MSDNINCSIVRFDVPCQVEILICDGKICGQGRHISGGKYICPHNNLKVLYPDLCKEWDYKKNSRGPETYTKGSKAKVWWICPVDTCGCHTYDMTIYNKTKSNAYKCSFCSSSTTKVCPHNNFLVDYPQIASQWDYERNTSRPEDFRSGSHEEVWWICQESTCACHRWKISIHNRTGSNKTGCPFCANQRICDHNNLAYLHPKLAKEWDYERNLTRPEEFVPGSHEKVWWICINNVCGCHRWFVRINQRVSGTCCPVCANQVVCGHNNLAYLHSDIAKEWDYERNLTRPEQFVPGSHEKVWWICSAGTCECHRWQAKIYMRTKINGTGCSYCCNHKTCSHNNLAILHPQLMTEWNYERNIHLPETYSYGSKQKVWWICIKKINTIHQWMTDIHHRVNGRKCPHCSYKRGYSEAQIQWLDYIMDKEDIDIQYAIDPEGEFRILGIGKVDGYCYENNTVYEFHGDYWHGNPNVFHPDDINEVNHKTFGELYRKTIERENKIRELGYNLIVKWESDL